MYGCLYENLNLCLQYLEFHTYTLEIYINLASFNIYIYIYVLILEVTQEFQV